MADIFEVMRQRIKNLEAELDVTSTQLKAMMTSKQELEEQLHTYKEALQETDSIREAVATQLRTGGHKPTVNVVGVAKETRSCYKDNGAIAIHRQIGQTQGKAVSL
jgi:hypothetical protein